MHRASLVFDSIASFGSAQQAFDTARRSSAGVNVAMISEHASPLATIGGIDAGGQNIYVAHTARHLARFGYGVDIFTRRDSPDLPPVVEWLPGVRVFNVAAGPAQFVRKEALLPYMAE